MPTTPSPRPLRSKIRRLLFALSLGAVLAVLLAELGVRFLVHHPNVSLGALGRSLRVPENFSDGNSEDDFWKIQYLSAQPEHAGPAENPDPITGWTGHYVKPSTYEHVDAPSIRGRRPILLYGDSFAQCNTPSYECFQSILERSDLAERYCLLNYGVGGYGLDQIYLLLKHSIDHYAALDPIVVVSLLVESDLDRCLLSFRCWPKPRLDVVGDELKARGAVLADPARWVRENPISFPSYLWRYLIFKRIPGLESWQQSLRGDHRRVGEKRALNFKIVKEIQRELEKRNLRYFMLLFHMESSALEKNPNSEWQEPLLYDAGRLLSIPIVDTRAAFTVAAREIGGVSRLYGHGSPLFGHLNALGNLVAFESIRQGLAGDFESKDASHLESWIASFKGTLEEPGDRPMQILGRTAETYAQGGRSWIRCEGAADPSHGNGGKVESVFMRAGASIPTAVRFALEPGLSRFSATVGAFERGGAACAGAEIELDVQVDGRSAWRRKVRQGEERVSFEVDIDGHQSLALLVSTRGASDECAWARLTEPRIE